MVTHRKKSLLFVLLAGMILLVALGVALFGGQPSMSASAAYEKMQPQANYTLRQFVDGKVEQTRTGQSDVWNIPYNEDHRTRTAYFYIVKRNAQGAFYYTDGKYGKSLNYQEIGIQVSTILTKQTLTLTDAQGRVLAMQTNDDELQVTLEEGEYHVNITILSNTWTRESDGKEEYYRLDAEYMFYVDMSAPYISGTYAEGEEQWVGVGHTVEALDDVSGDIKDFYFTKPDGAFIRYFAPQRSHTFQEGDLEGLYTFQAYDDASWHSGRRTVLFDGTAPVGRLSADDGTELVSGSTVKQGFSFSATDAMSGIAAMEYKTPSSSDWEPYVERTMIESTAEAGEYLFRATDQAGNCVTSSITLQSSDPCAAGHTYVSHKVDPTCTTGGYTVYTCSGCNDSYTADVTQALGHNYRATTTSGSCTSGGNTTYTCTRCGDRYTESTTAATGHSYVASIVEATCTAGGYTVYTCSVCKDSYTTDVTQALGHSYRATTTSGSCTSGGYTTYTCTRCGDRYTGNSTAATGHSFSARIVNPTCTSTGYTMYTCTKCGYNYTGNATAALGHSYEVVIEESTCTEGGVTTYKCTWCGISHTDNQTQATGHSYVASIVEETCTERGYTIYTCTKCGDSYRDNETAAMGHNYVTENVSATCTEHGDTVYTCIRCGIQYNGSQTEPLGHAYVTETVAATCEEGGYTEHTCSRCGSTYTDSRTPAMGHNYVTESVSATCTGYGGTVYTCTRCGTQYNGSQTEPLGHAYVAETVAATCEEGGYTEHTCSRCGSTYTDSVTQPVGHNFMVATKEPTCEAFGMTVYTCQVCGHEQSEESGDYPTGHNYSNSIVKTATCMQDGERRFVCDKCGDIYTEIIVAPGHSYAITDTTSENGNTTRVYTCTACGASYTQELGDQYEEVTSYVEDLFEQYRPYMVWAFLATAAIWSIVMGVFFAIAHKNEDKEKARKMIVNYFVGLVVIFVILVACPFLIRGIAALVT